MGSREGASDFWVGPGSAEGRKTRSADRCCVMWFWMGCNEWRKCSRIWRDECWVIGEAIEYGIHRERVWARGFVLDDVICKMEARKAASRRETQ